ncbi:MAG TPA: hypothetical protein VFD97_06145 [Acidimicrobiia bacterium]|nr:hypothetical protein [Acidimicrobiia bacterium]
MLEPLVAVRLLYATEPEPVNEDPKPGTARIAVNPTGLEVGRPWP